MTSGVGFFFRLKSWKPISDHPAPNVHPIPNLPKVHLTVIDNISASEEATVLQQNRALSILVCSVTKRISRTTSVMAMYSASVLLREMTDCRRDDQDIAAPERLMT